MPKPFNLLGEVAAFGDARQLSLRDPAFREAFQGHVRQSVDDALADPILLHGQRTEALFEALVVALDDVQLLKAEDGGRIFPADRYRVPDYRIVLNDGEQWLVEVKNVHIGDPQNQRRRIMHKAYHRAMAAYAEATGARLMLAVYWARWSIWTLVPPERFVDAKGDVVLDMMQAIPANELARLGDRTIGTRAPLRLRFVMDPAKTGPVGGDGQVLVVIGGSQLMCGDAVIEDKTEREIASIIMQYGEWSCDGPFPLIEGDRLHAIDFEWRPDEPCEDQGFDMIGTLSRMFSRYYASRTLDGSEIKQLRAPLRPAWFAPLANGTIVQRALPLWRFELQPRAMRDAA